MKEALLIKNLNISAFILFFVFKPEFKNKVNFFNKRT